MEASGIIEVGSHTHSHRDFRGKPHELVADLRRSLELLTERIGDRKYLFSFPFGGRSLGFASDAMFDIVANEGLLCALTTETELVVHGTSPFGWGRLEAHGSDTGAMLAAKLTGWYNWMGTARECFRRFSPPAIPTSEPA
jgi:peptidoglycan/xylan/chitin deacetylase (PgdA/CDA1 family)